MTHTLSNNIVLTVGKCYSINVKLSHNKIRHTYEDCTFSGYNEKSKTLRWLFDNSMIIIGYENDFMIFNRKEGELNRIF